MQKKKTAPLLDTVNSPDDIKKMTYQEISRLCGEIREELITVTSRNGGHLSSNLGTVELTVAMHRVFDSPRDQFVFDVGHQSYTHKILTGRRERFHTLRTGGGIAGFPKPCESEHDPVICGHSSTSISAAHGLAQAKKLVGDKHFTVVVIGDGALGGGLAYEGLNNAGRSRDKMIVILNDNRMSISKNVGAMARYLAKIRSQTSYVKFKNRLARFLGKIPLIGKPFRCVLFRFKAYIKFAIYKSNMFESLGFAYLGPIDGHDQRLLEQSLAAAKTLNRPVLIHVCTVKGKGFGPAEENPGAYHGVGKFDMETGELLPTGVTFSDVFGRAICEIAREDESVCAVTAAMKYGTGLGAFAKEFPKRFYDCGIAESHALTFCGGLATGGLKPVLAVYASFLQRGYDQMIHDIAIEGLNVTVAVDRAGVVGEDGETHQGIFDCAMLNGIPGITVYSPSTFAELEASLRESVRVPGAAVVRYPRGCEPTMPEGFMPSGGAFDLMGDDPAAPGEMLLVTYGRLAGEAAAACDALRKSGIRASLLKLHKIKPIDRACMDAAIGFDMIYFFEEGIKSGGIGESFAAMLLEANFGGTYRLRGIENFVQHASVGETLHALGLDAAGMVSAAAGLFAEQRGGVVLGTENQA